jgi:hypothetical protein
VHATGAEGHHGRHQGHYENLAHTWEKLAAERKTFFIEDAEKEADLSRGADAIK